MNYFVYLKKGLPGYFISGVLAGVFLFVLIATHRYEEAVSSDYQDLQAVESNKEKIADQLREIERLRKYFGNNYGIDIEKIDADGALLRGLDDMKRSLQGASFTVSNIETKNGKRSVEVTISAPMESYDMVIDYVSFLESFRLPDFEVMSLSISTGEAGIVSLNVKGALIMPAFGVQEPGYGA